MYSMAKIHVNAKRLPPLPGTTGRHSPEEDCCPHSITASRNRRGAALGAESQKHLGGAPKRMSAGELPHVLHGRMAGQKKANRAKQPKPSEVKALRETEAVEER